MTLKITRLCLQNGVGTSFPLLEYESTILHRIYATDPASKMSSLTMGKFSYHVGLNSCARSTGAAHVGIQKCPSWENINQGFKLDTPSRNCNATFANRHQVLEKAFGYLGTWSDK